VNNQSIPSKQQPYNHDSFSKISGASTALQSQLFLKNIENFYASRKLGIIVVLHQRTPKEKLLIYQIRSPLLHIPLLALTHGQTK
jgi:hypothetical protein